MFKEFQSEPQVSAPPALENVAPSDKVSTPPIPRSFEKAPQAVSINDARSDAYRTLKNRLHHFALEKLNLAMIDQVSPVTLRRELSTLVAAELKESGDELNTDAFKLLIDELLDEVLGLGPLEPLLADPSISDILVNGHNHVYVERGGMLERVPVSFSSERHLLRIIDKIVSRIGRRIDESQPWVDARLEDGSRVNAIIRPCTIDGPTLSIRKFSRKPLTLDMLVKYGALSQNAMTFLEAIAEARMNVLISGGTGSGKTTMLNALSSYIDHRQRIVTIEDAAELQLQQEHVVRLETRPANSEGIGAISQRDLVRNALRMRPDRIVIGEVRGSEAFDMLQAMNTGHDGSMTTIHANTARDSLSRLEQMVSMIGGDFPLSAIRGQISSGINIVIQLNRLSDGSRRIMSISEVTGLEGERIMMQDIFVFEKQGREQNGKIKGVFKATGIRPKCMSVLSAAGHELPLEIFSNAGTS
ncbi:MAG: CpaF family protein [Sulfitobacter sp.]